MELDLRIGAAFTRYQTIGYQGEFEDLAKEGVISFGTFSSNNLEQFKEKGLIFDSFPRSMSNSNPWFCGGPVGATRKFYCGKVLVYSNNNSASRQGDNISLVARAR